MNPRENAILAGLPDAVYERLLPDLKLVTLEVDHVLHRADDKISAVYFPVDSIAAKIYLSSKGKSVEIGLIGHEGMVGISLFMGGHNIPTETIVQTPGCAYRLSAVSLMREFDRGGELQRALLRFTEAFIVQMGQIAVCNRFHTVEQQLCRWLLSNLDRLPEAMLITTQDTIARMLGVRREGITRAIGVLRKESLIKNNRGHVRVLDRPKLETRACECYSTMHRAYEELLLPPPPAELKT